MQKTKIKTTRRQPSSPRIDEVEGIFGPPERERGLTTNDTFTFFKAFTALSAGANVQYHMLKYPRSAIMALSAVRVLRRLTAIFFYNRSRLTIYTERRVLDVMEAESARSSDLKSPLGFRPLRGSCYPED